MCIVRLMVSNEYSRPLLQVFFSLYHKLYPGGKLHSPFECSSRGVLPETSVTDTAEEKGCEGAIDGADGEAGEGEDSTGNEARNGHVLGESQ